MTIRFLLVLPLLAMASANAIAATEIDSCPKFDEATVVALAHRTQPLRKAAPADVIKACTAQIDAAAAKIKASSDTRKSEHWSTRNRSTPLEVAVLDYLWLQRARRAVGYALTGDWIAAEADLDSVIERLTPFDHSGTPYEASHLWHALMVRAWIRDKHPKTTTDIDEAAKLKRGIYDDLERSLKVRTLVVPTVIRSSPFLPIDLGDFPKTAADRVFKHHIEQGLSEASNKRYDSARRAFDTAASFSFSRAYRANARFSVGGAYCAEAEMFERQREIHLAKKRDGWKIDASEIEKTMQEARLKRSRGVEQLGDALSDATAAQADPKENAIYGAELPQLIGEILMLRANCRTNLRSEASDDQIKESLADVKKYIEVALPLGAKRKAAEALLTALSYSLSNPKKK